MSSLEQRCRLLLRAYPQPYRSEHAEEILATLLENTPAGSGWPTARDARSLLAGGLRVRMAQNRRLPLATNLRLAGLLAAALWLGSNTDEYLEFAIRPGHFVAGEPLLSAELDAVCALAALLTITSAWFWRRGVTVTLALAVVVASALAVAAAGHYSHVTVTSFQSDVWTFGPPLALAALAAGKDRPPRYWLWMPAVYILAPLPAILEHGPYVTWPIADLDALFIGIALVWFVVDARPVIAIGLYFELLRVLISVRFLADGVPISGQLLVITLEAAVLAAAALRLRRRIVS
jgi:hypothetical protein